MKTTRTGPVPPYIGADLTDRYSLRCRPIDICGLTPIGSGLLNATFWQWKWDPARQELDVQPILEELSTARCSMLDAPQGLADPGKLLRVCEEKSHTPGRTPDSRDAITGTYRGFILSSLDIFQTLKDAGATISPHNFAGGVNEVYPGHIWKILAGSANLPNKRTPQGREARKAILGELGIQCLPGAPTDDQNDACVAAVIAAAADGKVTGMNVERIGKDVYEDSSGRLREGPMAIPKITSDELRKRLDEVLREMLIVVPRHNKGRHHALQIPDEPAQRAAELLERLISRAKRGKPTKCSYSWAYRYLFGDYKKYSQAYTQQVINLAKRVGPKELPPLGQVYLDTFIVSEGSRRPGEGHWQGKSAEYQQTWHEILGGAELVHKRDG